MFKKFEGKDMVSGVNTAKSSVQRAVRASVLQDYPHLENYIDQILPKKESLKVVKCHEHVELLASSNGEILLFRGREGPYIPSLRLVHRFPFMLPWMQVDKGAIRFVLSGANIMCPGLTSPGAKMTKDLEAESVVAIMAEGKQHALAVGLTKMSTTQILEKNKGVGVENLHYVNDGLWVMKPVK